MMWIRTPIVCVGLWVAAGGCGATSSSEVNAIEAAASAAPLFVLGLPSGATLFKEVPLVSRDRGNAARLCSSAGYRTDSLQNWFELDLSTLTVAEKFQLKNAIASGRAYASTNVKSDLDSQPDSYGWYSFTVGVGGYEDDATSAQMASSSTYAGYTSHGAGDESRTRSIAVQVPLAVAAFDFGTSKVLVEAHGDVEAGCKTMWGSSADASLDTVTSTKTGGYEAALWIAP